MVMWEVMCYKKKMKKTKTNKQPNWQLYLCTEACDFLQEQLWIKIDREPVVQSAVRLMQSIVEPFFFFFALFRSNCWYWFLSPFCLCITHMFVTWLSFNRNDLFQQCDVPELCRCCLEVAHKSSHLWLNTHNIYMCVYVYMYTDINIYKYICTKNNFEFTRWWISCIYASFVGYFANQQPSLRRLHVFKET